MSTESTETEKSTLSTKKAERDAKLRRQNRILLNLVWWMALMFVGEAYVFSPLPAVISRNFVNDEHGLFWPVFWALFVAFLIVQGILHHRVLNKYWPDAPHNNRWVIGVPIAAFVGLVAVLLVLMPFSHL